MKFPFQSKFMIRKLIRIVEIASKPKSVYFPNNQIYLSQIILHKLRTGMKIVSKFHVSIFNTFREKGRQRALRLGRFIFLNDLASLKWSWKLISNFSDFFKVLELVEWLPTYMWLLIGISYAPLTRNKFIHNYVELKFTSYI